MNNLKSKYEKILNQNKNYKQTNFELNNKIENYEDEINSLNKIKNDLEIKNKKYKNGILQNEINSIEEHIENVKLFQQQIKKLQNETKKMKQIINNLEQEKNNLKEENINYINSLKNIKNEFKNILQEKINLINNNEKLKISNFNLNSQNEKLSNENKILSNENKNLLISLNNSKIEHEKFTELKEKYQNIFNDFNNVVNENKKLLIQTQEKKYSEKDINNLQQKFQNEFFSLQIECNLWKFNFLEISKFKLINFNDFNNNKKIENALKLNKNYLTNIPKNLQENSNNILNYFKNLIEQQNYKSINIKELKENLQKTQELNFNLQNQLEIEKFLRQKIHNRYMFLRGNLRVMCRLRPFISSEIINNKLPDLIKINNDSILINENGNLKSFEFDYIFNKNSTQQNVYEECSLLIQSMFNGNNICIIAYGQTCTGKTYTIQGPDNNNPGIVINAAKEIFDLISKNNNVNVRLTLTIIEIYKEQIFNLLDENLPNLNIYESNGNLMIPDLMPVSINNLDEAQKLFNLASKFRHIGNNDFNERSSRSHCIFTFKLKITNNNNKITRSTLNIIDLAGSERISKSNLKDENIKKEAININLSLHALSTVLNSIANKASHIPYRDSKLTHYLKESLNENYNILLILHISPNIKDLPESISTLQFGTRIVKICKHKTGKDKIQLINGKEK